MTPHWLSTEREAATIRGQKAVGHRRFAGRGLFTNANLRNFALWVIIVLLLLALFTLFQNPGQHTTSTDISFLRLLNEVDQGRVREVVIQGPKSTALNDGQTFQTYAPSDPTLVQRLYNKNVNITARPQSENVPWFLFRLLISWLPFVALIGVWIFLSRQMQGRRRQGARLRQEPRLLLTEAHGRVTFEDVAGVDEAKLDLVRDRRIPARSR